MPDWKKSVNLPRTSVPMKANLQVSEPETLARWETMNLYGLIRKRRAGAPKFILHDGPPYANGRIHIGHALNKILKDLVVKTRSMAGFDSPYVPGWDCHGLPIELKVDRELGPKKRNMTIAEFRRACRQYATRYVDIQREDFKRLSVFGDWSHPYLTMSYGYEAAIVRALGRFVEQGMVYKGKKPVHWCIHCRTALAEAEVEYEPHVSPSIYVRFPLAAASTTELSKRVPELGGGAVSVLIWTTTPWTIPSNLAIAFHPEFWYGAYESAGHTVIVAEDLAPAVSAATGRPMGRLLARFKGRLLEDLKFRHPLYERDSLGVLGDYVTLDQGTGAVHTAPGHGVDDFGTGMRYGLDIYAPVGADGHFTDEVGMFAGLRVFDANPRIEAALDERGHLWHRATFEHSYPHCWRCHNPVIFLATAQWFIAMDIANLRQRALEVLPHIRWVPPWGEERMRSMLSTRPDWCISRQRTWGVPIPAMYCTSCREAILTTELTARAAAVFEQHGSDSWYERPLEDFLPPELVCPACGGRQFERERDIVDVWFESGTSHEGVLPTREGLRWPADVYLEGSDQHRGWFHSSLLVGLATRGRSPFHDVVTHGFVVNEEGRKMSKSLGNDISPQEIIKDSGAEILRLWVAMVNYQEEVRLSKEILARVIEAYRKIRNTLRYLTANVYDFDPVADSLPLERLEPVDRYALARYGEAGLRVLSAYDNYEFQSIFHLLNGLMTVDLSAFYFDVSKDRLYTFGPSSAGRRSAQTAMFQIAEGLVRLLAPILPVTTDEIWRALPGPREESVHLTEFPDQLETLADPGLIGRWSRLIKVRDAVNVEIEKLRQQKSVGTSLEARVTLRAQGGLASLLMEHQDQLPMLFIASAVSVQSVPEVLDATGGEASYSEDDGKVWITVERAEGTKCPRCWRYVTEVSTAPEWEGLCTRCENALSQTPDPS